MRTNASGRIAAVLVGARGRWRSARSPCWQVVALASGDTGSIESAVALVVLTLVGAAAVLAFAVAIWRGQSWGRSGGIVTQVLILAVALGAATGAYADPSTALVLAVPALVVLVLLVLAVRDAGRRHAQAASDRGRVRHPADPPAPTAARHGVASTSEQRADARRRDRSPARCTGRARCAPSRR